MKCITMFAGPAVRNHVLHQLNALDNLMDLDVISHGDYDDLEWGIEGQTENGRLGNLMNIQSDAHTDYDDLKWGIEGRLENGTV